MGSARERRAAVACPLANPTIKAQQHVIRKAFNRRFWFKFVSLRISDIDVADISVFELGLFSIKFNVFLGESQESFDLRIKNMV